MQNTFVKKLPATLHDIQRQFINALLTPNKAEIDFIDQKKNLNMPPELQISIYQGSVLGNLSNALSDVFPVCKRLLGDDYFTECCYKFIYQHPPKANSIFYFGGEFSLFLTTINELEDMPYISDIALLEWHYHRIFHAKKSANISFNDLAAIPPEQHIHLVFKLSPELATIRSEFPLLNIWRMNQENWQGEQTINLTDSSDNLVIWRYENTSSIKLVDDESLYFLEQISKSHTLGDIMNNKPSLCLEKILPQAFKNKWIIGFNANIF